MSAEKIKVRVEGRATVSVSQDVYMTQRQFDDMCAALDGDDVGQAVDDALFGFADLRNGDFDDLELETFEAIP